VTPEDVLYYEAHITIDPVFDARFEQLSRVAKAHSFRVADLMMQKRREDTPERSKYDTFMTSRDREYDGIVLRVRLCVAALRNDGFVVRRAKIEAALYDERFSPSQDNSNGQPSIPDRA